MKCKRCGQENWTDDFCIRCDCKLIRFEECCEKYELPQSKEYEELICGDCPNRERKLKEIANEKDHVA